MTSNLKNIRDKKNSGSYSLRVLNIEKAKQFLLKKPNLTLPDLKEYDHDKNVFGEWKSHIIQKADSIIHHLSRRFNSNPAVLYKKSS